MTLDDSITYCIGLVLVDPSHGDEDERLPEEWRELMKNTENGFATARMLAPISVPRLLVRSQGPKFFTEQELLPESAQSALRDLGPRYSQISAAVREIEARNETRVQLEEATIPMGDLPLTVLTAGKPSYGLGQSFIDAWMEMHAELAGLSSSGRRRVVEECAHFIHVEQPTVVVEEILKLVEKSRNAQRGTWNSVE